MYFYENGKQKQLVRKCIDVEERGGGAIRRNNDKRQTGCKKVAQKGTAHPRQAPRDEFK